MLALFRLVPWVLMFVGGVWIVGGLATLSGDVETTPTKVSISALERSEFPDAQWLEVSNGYLYWPEAFSHFKTRQFLMDGSVEQEVTKGLGYYVPLVSGQLAETWLQDTASGQSVSYESCRVLVFFAQQVADRAFPGLARGVAPEQPTELFTVNGISNAAGDLEEEVAEALEGGTTNLDLSGMIVVRHTDEPLQKGTAAGIVVMGLVVAGPSFLWVRWRARRRRRKAASLDGDQVLPPGDESVHDVTRGPSWSETGAASHEPADDDQAVSAKR